MLQSCALALRCLGTCPLGTAPPRCQLGGANFPTSARSAHLLASACSARAGVSGKNMFIRHVLRHVEIKRFWWLGAAEMRTRVALVLALVLKKLSVWQGILGEFQCRVFQGIPAFPVSLSVEGVFQMAYILPERLLALVRPAFDLVLRRIRSLKRCVQA